METILDMVECSREANRNNLGPCLTESHDSKTLKLCAIVLSVEFTAVRATSVTKTLIYIFRYFPFTFTPPYSPDFPHASVFILIISPPKIGKKVK